MKDQNHSSWCQSWALHMASQGFSVIPVYGMNGDKCDCGRDCNSSGKHPIGEKWHPMKSPDEIRQFWQSQPNANYGVKTTNLVVIDVDERGGGGESYRQYLEPILREIRTFRVRTGSGGASQHIYLKTQGGGMKSRTGIFPGVDIKAGDGGYVIGVGSQHKSGNFYTPLDMGSPDGKSIYIADVPESLISLLDQASSKLNKTPINSTGMVGPGERNNTLAKYVGTLWSKGHSYEEILPLVLKMNSTFTQPLDETEAISVLKSITSRYPPGNVNIKWKEPNIHFRLADLSSPSFDLLMVPEMLRTYIFKKSLQMGVPMSAIAVALLTIISSVLGSRFRVKPSSNSDYMVSLNLWGLIVAPSSARKTSVLNILKEVLSEIDKDFMEARRLRSDNSKKEIAKIKVQLKENKNLTQEEKADLEFDLLKLKELQSPKWLHYTSDTTQESLGELFRDNRKGVLLLKDELGGLFDIFSKQGYENLRSFLTESWNGGQSYRFSRVQRGIIDIPSITLSILGGVQPDILAQSFACELKNGKSNDGFLARFQLCSIYGLQNLIPPQSDINLDIEATKLNQLIRGLHSLTYEYNINPEILPETVILSPDACSLFEDFSKKNNIQVLKESENNSAYSSHIGKFPRLLLSLSGQFHILKCLVESRSCSSPVEKETVHLAKRLVEAMSEQVRSLYDLSANRSSKTIINRIKSGDIKDGMSIRSISRKGWSGLYSKEDILNAIESLQHSEWIKVVIQSPQGGGRPTEIIRLNPKLISLLDSGTPIGPTDETDEGDIL